MWPGLIQSTFTWGPMVAAEHIHHQPTHLSNQPVTLPKGFQGGSGLPNIRLFLPKRASLGTNSYLSYAHLRGGLLKKVGGGGGGGKVGWIR